MSPERSLSPQGPRDAVPTQNCTGSASEVSPGNRMDTDSSTDCRQHAPASVHITTCRGVVSERLRSRLELQLMRCCFRELGLPCAGNLAGLSVTTSRGCADHHVPGRGVRAAAQPAAAAGGGAHALLLPQAGPPCRRRDRGARLPGGRRLLPRWAYVPISLRKLDEATLQL